NVTGRGGTDWDKLPERNTLRNNARRRTREVDASASHCGAWDRTCWEAVRRVPGTWKLGEVSRARALLTSVSVCPRAGKSHSLVNNFARASDRPLALCLEPTPRSHRCHGRHALRIHPVGRARQILQYPTGRPPSQLH